MARHNALLALKRDATAAPDNFKLLFNSYYSSLAKQ